MKDTLFNYEPPDPDFEGLSKSYRSNPEQFFKAINKAVHDSGTPTSHTDALMLYVIHKAHRFGKVDELSDMMATWAEKHVLRDICHDAEFNVDDD